jgi:hypothetical protein
VVEKNANIEGGREACREAIRSTPAASDPLGGALGPRATALPFANPTLAEPESLGKGLLRHPEPRPDRMHVEGLGRSDEPRSGKLLIGPKRGRVGIFGDLTSDLLVGRGIELRPIDATAAFSQKSAPTTFAR